MLNTDPFRDPPYPEILFVNDYSIMEPVKRERLFNRKKDKQKAKEAEEEREINIHLYGATMLYGMDKVLVETTDNQFHCITTRNHATCCGLDHDLFVTKFAENQGIYEANVVDSCRTAAEERKHIHENIFTCEPMNAFPYKLDDDINDPHEVKDREPTFTGNFVSFSVNTTAKQDRDKIADYIQGYHAQMNSLIEDFDNKLKIAAHIANKLALETVTK